MKKSFSKNFILFLSVIFVSCAPKNDEPVKIRIVDLQGKPHPVATRTPELNNQALMAQGVQKEQKSSVVNAVPATPKTQQEIAQNYQTQDYGDTIQKTFQPNAQQNMSSEQTQIRDVAKDEAMLAAGSPQAQEETIEYDLSDAPEEKVVKKEVKKNAKKPAKKAAPAAKAVKGKYFVQVGSFGSISNANQTLDKMEKFHSGKVETIEGEKTIYRVVLGPFSNKAQANAMVAKIKKSGHEAILVRNK